MTAVQDLLIRECITCTMWVRQIQCSILFTVQFSSLPRETNIMKDIWFVCLFVCLFWKQHNVFYQLFQDVPTELQVLKSRGIRKEIRSKNRSTFPFAFPLISHPIPTLFSPSHFLSPSPIYPFPSKTLVGGPFGLKKKLLPATSNTHLFVGFQRPCISLLIEFQ